MKNYKDITERVFRRGDEILRQRQKRTAIIKRTSFAVSGMCAAVLICFGVWHNNDIKDSLNDFHDNSNIITENDSNPQITTDIISPTSTSIIPQTTTDIITQTTMQTSTNTPLIIPATQTVTSAETVIFTDSSPTHTAQTETEYLHEATRIMLSTAFQTNSTQTITSVVQTTTTLAEENDEGGLYMKKLTSFFTSAVVLAASATPVIGHAEFNVDTSRYWAGEKAMFAAMDSGELETDIDGNGVVDAIDGYLLECYTYSKGATVDLRFYVSDEINSRIEAIADYNGDGVIDHNDTTSWVRHFIANHGLNADIFSYDYYTSEYISIDEDYYASEYLSLDDNYYKYSKTLFTSQLYSNMEALHAGYYVVSDMYRNGTLDLDVNGNGQLDIEDAYNIQAWNECDDVFKVYCSTVSKSPSASVYVSKYNFTYYATLCIMENIELKSEYFTKEYYVQTFGENSYRSETIAHNIEQSAAALGMKPDDDAWLKFDTDDLNDFFASYCKDVENGVRPAPDVNMDGVVDYYDYFDSNIYFGDLLNDRTADDSILPVETWNNLAENCDFNGNGTSRDIFDILAVQIYVVKYADKIDNFSEAYETYTESLGGVSAISIEGFSYENNVAILAANTLCGDANEDGAVDIADATAIIQHIGNNKKYGLSRQGEINADCYNTGDGVTGMDALTIQRLAAHVIDTLPVNE